MLDVLVKWPTRNRATLFRSTFAKWQNPSVRFLVSLDEDDSQNTPEFRAWLDAQQNVRHVTGKSTGKIHAINRDLEHERFDLLIVASDDMIPVRADFYERIIAYLYGAFPDGDALLHVNDGRAGYDLCTLPIMGRKYYERFNYVYHPAYASLWADNEQTEVARSLNRYVYCPEVLVSHEWDRVTGQDALHVHNESFYASDQAIYEQRKAAGFV
jgi:hypothetical protein